MKKYLILKPVWIERFGYNREVRPGEIIEFTPEVGAILAGRNAVLEIGESEAQRRQTRHRRVRDPELDKLDKMEV